MLVSSAAAYHPVSPDTLQNEVSAGIFFLAVRYKPPRAFLEESRKRLRRLQTVPSRGTVNIHRHAN